MRLRLTHLLFAGSSEARPPDALGADEAGKRFFVPGWLPCGECGPCRRGWMAACPRGQALTGAPVIEASERFPTPLDDPPEVAALDEGRAACAGAVAQVQELAARAGLGSGDLAVWIGDDALTTLGARLATARGCATFQVRADEDPQRWVEAVAAAAAGAPGGFIERRLFLASADPASIAAARALTAPGATLAFLDGSGSGALRPSDLPSSRILVGDVRAYHPDLVAEALAALRRAPAVLQDLLTEGAAPADRDPRRLTLIKL
jgi:threonine dehydrogenase-like Zn-dependent dehydrogenase